MRRLTSLLCLLALLCASCSTLGLTNRSPTVERIRSSGTLHVGIAGDYPPLNIRTRSGAIIGLDADLARMLAMILEVELVLVEKPFGELLSAVQSGEIDAAISGITMIPRRNMDVAFAGPYFVSKKAILGRADKLAGIAAIADLDPRDVTLVALEGSTSQQLVEKAAPNATHHWVKTQDEAIQMVLDGTAGAMVADSSVCGVALLRHPGKGLLMIESMNSYEPIGIAVSVDDALFLNLVENYLRSLEGLGLLDHLRARWFEDASWLELLP
jgi:polar amino acid transport system substrate-binding protein